MNYYRPDSIGGALRRRLRRWSPRPVPEGSIDPHRSALHLCLGYDQQMQTPGLHYGSYLLGNSDHVAAMTRRHYTRRSAP